MSNFTKRSGERNKHVKCDGQRFFSCINIQANNILICRKAGTVRGARAKFGALNYFVLCMKNIVRVLDKWPIPLTIPAGSK